MKLKRDRRPMTVDTEHMRRLHLEAFEQLELLRTVIEAADQASGTARDTLDDIAVDHWNGYLDILHMITLHDDLMAAALRKHGMSLREGDGADSEQEYCGNRLLLLPLISAMSRRHRRFSDVYGWRGYPQSDYRKESMTAEREHMAELIALIQQIM